MNKTKVLELSPLSKLEDKRSISNGNNKMKIDFLFGLMHYQYKSIMVSDTKTTDIVPISSILYIKSSSNYSTFYMIDGKPKVTSRPLKYWQDKIADSHFLRCHNSFLINGNHVKSINMSENSLTVNDNIVPISRSKKHILLEYFS